jgi:UDP-GlcNAc3NAcA epimerase
MKCALIAGVRPQFIKAAVLLPALRERCETLFVHTGQHADPRMSAAQFADLALPDPDVVLVSDDGARLTTMTAQLAAVFREHAIERVVVMGDTDSTVAGARAAREVGLPCAHVEAGCRSGEPDLPEERNRIEVDGLCDLLLCSTERDAAHLSASHLSGESVAGNSGAQVHVVGDVMADLLLAREAEIRANAPRGGDPYAVLTIHRAATADDPALLDAIFGALDGIGMRVLFPKHPRIRRTDFPAFIQAVLPLPYGEFLSMVAGAARLLTDSGGLQKEAYLLGVPCITLRDATEWGDTVDAGWNVLTGTDPIRIRAALAQETLPGGAADRPRPPLFGDGAASQRVAALIASS